MTRIDAATTIGAVVVSNKRAWPLVGRDVETALCSDALENDRSVLVCGPAGVGKTALARHLADPYPDDEVVRVAAASGLSLPFDAVAAAGASRSGERPPLVFIDDVHLVDDDAAALLHRLITQHEIVVVGTVRTGEHCPPAITNLWKDEHAERIDLALLDRASVDEVLDEALGGVIEARTRRTFWEITQGSPLMLRELMRSALEDGSLEVVGGLWRLSRAPSSVRLDELIGSRLAALSDDVRWVVELVALGEPVGFESLVAAAGIDAVAAAEKSGLVDAVTNGLRREVRLGHPMFGDVTRRRLSEAETARRCGELLTMMSETPRQRRDDILQTVAWRLRAGGTVMSHDMVLAARRAMYDRNEQLAIELATRALADDRVEATLVLGDVLVEQGDHEQAESMLRDLATTMGDGQAALVALQLAGVMFWGVGNVDEALGILIEAEQAQPPGPWRDELRAQRGVLLVNNGRIIEGLALAEPLLGDEIGDRARVTAGIAASLAMTLVGRSEDACAVAISAFETCSLLGRRVALTDPGIFVVSQAVAMTEHGDLRGAEALSREMYDFVVEAGERHGQGWLAMSLGRVCLNRGLVSEAHERFIEAAGVFAALHHHGPQRWALAGAVISAAQRGADEAAETAWQRLGEVPPHPATMMEAEVDRAQAWIEVVRGDRNEAIAVLDASAHRSSEQGAAVLTSSALHDMVRLGGKVAVERWDHLRGRQGDLLPLSADFGAAVQARSAPELVAVARRFEAIGADLFAAESHAFAAVFHDREGRSRAATTCRRAAAQAQHRLGEEWSTTLDSIVADATRAVVRLTDRELEIATRASEGATSRMIAEEFGLSPRTVDNHLQRCYTKLGVRGRRELPGALAHLLPG